MWFSCDVAQNVSTREASLYLYGTFISAVYVDKLKRLLRCTRIQWQLTLAQRSAYYLYYSDKLYFILLVRCCCGMLTSSIHAWTRLVILKKIELPLIAFSYIFSANTLWLQRHSPSPPSPEYRQSSIVSISKKTALGFWTENGWKIQSDNWNFH